VILNKSREVNADDDSSPNDSMILTLSFPV
jgi:hypothetical protein